MAVTRLPSTRPSASFRERLFSQFGHPRGTLGRLAGRVMAMRISLFARLLSY